ADALAQLPPDTELEDLIGPISDLATAVGEAIAAVSDLSNVNFAALPAPFSDQALWTALAEEAADLVIVRYLDVHQALIGGALRFLGVLVEEPTPASGSRSE